MDDHPVADGSPKARTAHHAQTHEERHTYNRSVNCYAGPNSVASKANMILLPQPEHVCSDRNNTCFDGRTRPGRYPELQWALCALPLWPAKKNCGSIAVKRPPARKNNIAVRTHMFQIQFKKSTFSFAPCIVDWWSLARRKRILQRSLRNASRRKKNTRNTLSSTSGDDHTYSMIK